MNAVAVAVEGGATTAVNAEGDVPTQQRPRSRSSTTAGSSSGGKQKILVTVIAHLLQSLFKV